MKLTMRKSDVMEDWYLIERLEHDGREWMEQDGPNTAVLRCSSRFSDADVEGSSREMLLIAEAIERREEESFKRCAVDATSNPVLFWSPRNSQKRGAVSKAEADELAVIIRTMLGVGDRTTSGEAK